MDRQLAQLLATAARAAENAYAPYSKFRVGVAVLAAKGIYVAANVENASYGLSLCAERAALAGAISQGERDIRAIAIACIDAREGSPMNLRVPCGACRQWIAELAPRAQLVLLGSDKVFQVSDFLPNAFRLS